MDLNMKYFARSTFFELQRRCGVKNPRCAGISEKETRATYLNNPYFTAKLCSIEVFDLFEDHVMVCLISSSSALLPR